MQTNNELAALLKLIDDPDEDVFGAVSEKIIQYGSNIIPSLENLWETLPDEGAQSRIEHLIHRLHVKDLRHDLKEWNDAGHHDLMVGALLVSKFQYPELTTTQTIYQLDKLKRNIWLELNQYLTPLEQVRIVSGILFGYAGLKGGEKNYENPDEFLIHKVVESKRGNQVSNGILYLILCDLLDIPIKAIAVPKQFVLAYCKPPTVVKKAQESKAGIEFYIDPASGQVFTQKDLDNYYNRIDVVPEEAHFTPLSSKRIVQLLMQELAKCFRSLQQDYKSDELSGLITMLD